ncbi:MAG: hypothetical protein ACR2QC_10700 [Gammaproteobacteria bacterium]
MIDAVIAAFVAHLNIIYLSAGVLSALGYVARHRGQSQLGGIISTGVLGASIPVGILLMLTSYRSDLTDELREFPLAICILGFAYIVYAALEIVKKYKK